MRINPLLNALILGAALGTALGSAVALAHDFRAGDLRVVHPWARPTPPAAKTGGAYFTLQNKGTQPDRLVSASSPAAKRVELHTMAMEGTVMRMREVKSIAIAAGETVALRPGEGYHLMLVDLAKPLERGARVPLKLTFEKAGSVDVVVHVEQRGKDEPAHTGHPEPK